MAFIGNTNTTQAFTPAVDFFSGNGSITAFTLSRPVASVAQVQVTIDNVAQNPSSAFTVSANTITFTSAPLSGTNNIYVYYTSPITQVIAPGQSTVGLTAFSATGTPSASTYLRGDNSWAALSGVVTSNVAGTGVSVSGATGAVTINATGSTINSQTGAYVLLAADAGKTISITTGGVTIPNAVMSAGNIVSIYNNSGSSQTITQGASLTLQWAGQTSSQTGNRTLGLYGMATVIFITASNAVISGAGLT